MADQQYIIGFSNLDERNPFTVTVRENLEAVAGMRPDVQLIVRNNALDTPTAMANAREFADVPVDVAIIFHIDERAGQDIVQPLRDKRIPIIAVDIPIAGTIFFGINNSRTGAQAGTILADWINKHWNGQLDKILVLTEYRVLDIFRQRFGSAVDKLEELVPSFSRDHVLYLDNGGEREITAERVYGVLERWEDSHHIAIVSMNDKVSAGALDAIREQNRIEDVALLSYDGTAVAINEFRQGKTSLVVSPSLRPEAYGQGLLELALKLARGEHVPQWNYVETIPVTQANYTEFA